MMLTLMDTNTRLGVEVIEDTVAFAAVGFKDADIVEVRLKRNQVERLYSALGHWLGNSYDPFVSDVV